MAKKPRRTAPVAPPTFIERIWTLIKRHPGKAVLTAVVFLGGIPTAAGGYSMLSLWAEPVLPALHYWVLGQLEPILKVQNTQAVGLDRFLLYQQQNALATAKIDPASKTSPIVQERIKELEAQARDTQARICKATGKGCP